MFLHGSLSQTWREADTVNGSKVTFEVLNFYPSLEVKLVQLEILSSTDEYLLVHVQRGGVGRAGDAHLLELLKPGIVKCMKQQQDSIESVT